MKNPLILCDCLRNILIDSIVSGFVRDQTEFPQRNFICLHKQYSVVDCAIFSDPVRLEYTSDIRCRRFSKLAFNIAVISPVRFPDEHRHKIVSTAINTEPYRFIQSNSVKFHGPICCLPAHPLVTHYTHTHTHMIHDCVHVLLLTEHCLKELV